MSGTLVHIADRLLNRPLLMLPQRAEVLLHVLQERIGVAGDLGPDSSAFVGSRRRNDGRVALTRADSGVAIVPVLGSLVNRGAWINAPSGLSSYEGIAAQLREAANDKDVHSIMLDIDSPGGECLGTFTLATLIRTIGAKKRVLAFVNDMAASAAYAIASAASEIVISPTSVLGSIGVVMLHADFSRKLEKDGIKPTLIHAGARKVDGNPYQPLTDEVHAELRAEIEQFYGLFLECVDAGRGAKFDADAARKTEARTYIGEDNIKLGLADRMATLDEVLADLQRKPAGTKRQALPTAQPSASLEITPAAIAAARAEGAAAERERLRKAIHDPRVKGREQFAAMLVAGSPGMSVDEICSFVAEHMPASRLQMAIPSLNERAASVGSIADPIPFEFRPTGTDGTPDFVARMKARHGVKA